MYLKDKTTDDLVEVLNVKALADPFQKTIQGCFHAGEELQDPMDFDKMNLLFPSGESLPQCWVDPDYKKN